MLHRIIARKKWEYIPHLAVQRMRVTIASKEPYDASKAKHIEPVGNVFSSKPGKSDLTDLFAAFHRTWTLPIIKDHFKKKEMQHLRESQSYLDERHRTLGSDLAATHFITFRGGKVKFRGIDKWMTYEDIVDDNVPSVFNPCFTVEEIDASGTLLCFEGFENLCYLRGLKKLILKNCPHVDDFCLRKAYLFENTLESLDLSGCENVTERGISTLYMLKHLKTLVIHDTPNILNKELVCLLLQDELPGCKFEGVDFDDPLLFKRLKRYMN